ncbi:MAG TPA: S46 family peptidase [Thermoanaerobaculia bacterium]|nr:S46 family peptidase [Thermoanaerobaculia bacterium]
MKRLALLLLFAANAFALEGKWTPQQVLQLDAAWLRKQGLELPPSRLWDPKRGTGLLAAAIDTSGCSGGFISAEGLFITNHHCLFSILQEHATPQDDIITNGFLAASREKELKGSTQRVAVPHRFTDVTAKVLAAVPAGATDADRAKAIDHRSTELVAECEKQPRMRCKVAAFDGGAWYTLFESIDITDVRLVYAPPRAIGEYGGETDNWMWPRHTGDFAIGRAYVDGKPYKPEFWFPIQPKGIKPDDFVMVLGYPGITYRALTAAEMAERRDLYFTRRREVYGEWIDLLEKSTAGNSAGEIAVADNLKTLANRFKNAEGQLAGFKRGSILEKQQARDEKVLAWARKQPKHADAVAAYEGLAAMINDQKRTWERDFLLGHTYGSSASPTPIGPKALYLATTVVRNAIELQKPDAERDALYMQRNQASLQAKMRREQKNFFAPADKRLLESWVRRAQALPAGQHFAAIDRLFPGAEGGEEPLSPSAGERVAGGRVRGDADLAARIDQLYAQTKLFDESERMKMLAESPEQLRARHDPLIDLGFALDADIRDLGARKEQWDGIVSRLRPAWRRAVEAHAGQPIAPDANSTLRVSFAHVKGYSPRDGAWYRPQTTLAGVVEKDTGADPFNAPPAILEAAKAQRYGQWKDPRLGDVPVDFLADADTTGGNSGSPVINGRGELVGVNFDRVWENVANDFGYNPAVGRNVNVDIRYLLWILDQVAHGDGLLRELGVR